MTEPPLPTSPKLTASAAVPLGWRVGLVAVLLGYAGWYTAHFLPNFDLVALLGGARRWGFDARYGQEIWEINPPLIMYLLKLPVALERLGLGAASTLFTFMMAGLAAFCGLMLARVLSALELVPRKAFGMASGVVAALVVLSAYNFVQREMVLIFLALPGLVLLAADVAGAQPLRTLPRALASFLVALAGFGALIKPHYALVFWGVVFLGVCVRRRAFVADYAVGLAVAFGLSLGYVALLFQSGWISFYLDYGSLYAAYTKPLAFRVTVFAYHAVLGVGLLLLAVCVGLSRARVLALLSLGAMALFGAALLQDKAYLNHFLPFYAVFFLVIALAMGAELPLLRARLRAGLVGLLLAPVLISLPLTWGVDYAPAARTTLKTNPLYQHIAAQAGQPMVVMSAEMPRLLSVGEALQRPQALRFPGFWQLSALKNQGFDSALSRQLLGKMGEAVAADLTAANWPDVYIDKGAAGVSDFDFVGLLSASPDFATVWARYHLVPIRDEGWLVYAAR